MANRILSIPFNNLAEAVDATSWPEFMKQILLYRLYKRQVDIAKIFYPEMEVTEFNPSVLVPQSIHENSSQQDLESFVRATGIVDLFAGSPEGSALTEATAFLIRELRKLGATDSEAIVTLKKNEPLIASCRDSAVINILEEWVYPGGLSSRIKRSSDNKERKCVYRGKKN
jgi:hypothetical protein